MLNLSCVSSDFAQLAENALYDNVVITRYNYEAMVKKAEFIRTMHVDISNDLYSIGFHQLRIFQKAIHLRTLYLSFIFPMINGKRILDAIESKELSTVYIHCREGEEDLYRDPTLDIFFLDRGIHHGY